MANMFPSLSEISQLTSRQTMSSDYEIPIYMPKLSGIEPTEPAEPSFESTFSYLDHMGDSDYTLINIGTVEDSQPIGTATTIFKLTDIDPQAVDTEPVESKFSIVKLTDEVPDGQELEARRSTSHKRRQDLEMSETKRRRKEEPVIKEEMNKKCMVCGGESSGFHYGADTCEPCKLFFSRNVQTISSNPNKPGAKSRQTAKLNYGCPTKNCPITESTRSQCPECRFKKCIAVGMSKNKIVFGRQAKTNSAGYVPNLTQSLCDLLQGLKETCRINYASVDLNAIIYNFYYETLKLLLQEDELAHENLNPLDVHLPKSIQVLFCVLFELDVEFDQVLVRMALEIREQIDQIGKRVFTQPEHFTQIFKIGIFIKVIRVLLETTPVTGSDQCERRLSDLMRSEFFAVNKIPFDYRRDDSTSSISSSTDRFDSSRLFFNLNYFLYRNLDLAELEEFVIKRCFV